MAVQSDGSSMSAATESVARWRVTLADNTTRTIEAQGFRVEHGALVLVLPLGWGAAFAPGYWGTIEETD